MKDVALDAWAERVNVAQFVSFDPSLGQRHCRIVGRAPNEPLGDVSAAVAALLQRSPEGKVNVRSYEPQRPKSREFLYGLDRADDVASAVRRLAASGLYTIVNETIDVHDGGVSGVVIGETMEFSPDDTPRCVEKAGTASLSRDLGTRLLETAYGFPVAVPGSPASRVEFSIHPERRGWRRDHVVIWEIEALTSAATTPTFVWPNNFSRMIGDKTYGLLLAHLLGLPVPATVAIPRRVRPFSFGRPTGTGEGWTRTCPVEQVPGRFATERGWRDPFALMSREDPGGTSLAAVLWQEGVDAAWAGALMTTERGEPVIEGVAGSGDAFMIGKAAPQTLPAEVRSAVERLWQQSSKALGPVRMEWAVQGTQAWVVQIHRGASKGGAGVIVPGEPQRFIRFETERGLDELRELIPRVLSVGEGIILVGDVGVTSHFGDILRKANVPSRLERP